HDCSKVRRADRKIGSIRAYLRKVLVCMRLSDYDPPREVCANLIFMAQATYDDANLLLKLYDLRREEKMREARAWFIANFKPKTFEEMMKLCPPGSPESARMRQVVTYWDMAASFVSMGVLNPEMFFVNNREFLLVWLRVRPYLAELRQKYGDPAYFKHLETAGNLNMEFLSRTSPGALEEFVKRVG
ncbi:MAG TPA: hypothetical protein VHA14_09645, partial [Bryobacteraceae bacterium]|nr:hypothetical protein [Bryobacteraceae bacterium]